MICRENLLCRNVRYCNIKRHIDYIYFTLRHCNIYYKRILFSLLMATTLLLVQFYQIYDGYFHRYLTVLRREENQISSQSVDTPTVMMYLVINFTGTDYLTEYQIWFDLPTLITNLICGKSRVHVQIMTDQKNEFALMCIVPLLYMQIKSSKGLCSSSCMLVLYTTYLKVDSLQSGLK